MIFGNAGRAAGRQPGRTAVVLPDGTTVHGLGRRQLRPDGPVPDHGLYLGKPGRRDLWRPSWPCRWVDWPDFGVPRDGEDAAAAIVQAYHLARDGRHVEVACSGGTGRTGTVIACLAVLAGHPAADARAWARAHYRPHAVETPGQRRWIGWFAERVAQSPY